MMQGFLNLGKTLRLTSQRKKKNRVWVRKKKTNYINVHLGLNGLSVFNRECKNIVWGGWFLWLAKARHMKMYI